MISSKEYVKKLRNSGLRPTKQRIKICELLFNSNKTFHFTINDIAEMVKKNHKEKVSLATIYRTLRLLVQMEFLHELDLSEGGHRFELASNDHPDHHHLVCISCGRTEEFESDQKILFLFVA